MTIKVLATDIQPQPLLDEAIQQAAAARSSCLEVIEIKKRCKLAVCDTTA